MTNKLIEAMARAVARSNVCGATIDGCLALCDDQRIESDIRFSQCDCRDAAQAVLKAISDTGYAVAPREPTEAMTAMGGNVLDCADSIDAAVIYRAMINATTTEEI